MYLRITPNNFRDILKLSQKEMDRLLEKCGQIINSSRDYRELLNRICHAFVQYGKYRMVLASYRDSDGNEIPVAESGLDDTYLSNPEFQCWFTYTLTVDSRFNVTFPLTIDGERLGSLILFTSILQGFDNNEKAALQRLACQIAEKLRQLKK